MDNKGIIRMATLDDSDEILSIYAPYILKTAISFEYEVPSKAEFKQRMETILEKYPWLVYEENGEILGYAYAGPEYTRAAYNWTCESSIYIREDKRGMGIGSKLYESLFKILKKQNFRVCYSIIISDNLPSVKMHEMFDFKIIGENKETGFKLGAWYGTYKMEKILNPTIIPPEPIIPITELSLVFDYYSAACL